MLETNRESTVNSSDTIADNKELVGFYIIAMDWEHLRDINKPNQPFMVFSRIVPAFENGKWTWTEELFDIPYDDSVLKICLKNLDIDRVFNKKYNNISQIRQFS